MKPIIICFGFNIILKEVLQSFLTFSYGMVGLTICFESDFDKLKPENHYHIFINIFQQRHEFT